MSQDDPYSSREHGEGEGQGHTHGHQQSTPLDLLLNAISGSSTHYPYPAAEDGEEDRGLNTEELNLGGFLGAQEHMEETRKRARGSDSGSPRRNKVARAVQSNIGSSPSYSTVRIWHARTAQKGYGKERRMLNPPPTLTVTGPLLPLLTSVTLSTQSIPSPSVPNPIHLSSQTHRIPLIPQTTEESASRGQLSRRAERQEEQRKLREAAVKSGFGASLPWERRRMIARERDALSDGLTFPGLWVGDAIGKEKEFQLELKLGQPGEDISVQATQLEPQNRQPVHHEQQQIEHQQPLEPHQIHPELSSAELHEMHGMQDGSEFILDHSISTLDDHIHAVAGPSSSNIPEISQQAQHQPQVVETSDVGTTSTWATFVSPPLTIVSKPSQKTAKARSMTSCLTERDTVSLFVRINSQTVRTKFMKMVESEGQVEGGAKLASRTGKWSPFRFEVIQKAVMPVAESRAARGRFRGHDDNLPSADILTYGSVVSIVDVSTGIRSDPVKLVRVDKNEVIVGADEGHPISELQRVGFVRLHADFSEVRDGSRFYLSAPGARAGGGELLEPREMRIKSAVRPSEHTNIGSSTTLGDITLDADNATDPSSEPAKVKKKRKTQRNALAKATLEEDENSAATLLVWSKAEEETKEVKTQEGKEVQSRLASVEKVDDWMCWVITGVSCFSYTFFDGTGGGGIPSAPLDPTPRLLADPILDTGSSTLDLVLNAFDPADPFDVYLGPLGPLRVSFWRSTAPSHTAKGSVGDFPAVKIDPTGAWQGGNVVNGRRICSQFPEIVPHVLIVVEMPGAEDIVGKMEQARSETKRLTPEGGGGYTEDTLTAEQSAPGTDAQEESAVNNGNDKLEGEGQQNHEEMASSWLADDHGHLETGELTIQEALRNAEDALHRGLDLESYDSQIIDPLLGPQAAQGSAQEDGQQVSQEGHQDSAASRPQPDLYVPEAGATIGLSRPIPAAPASDLPPLSLLLVRRSDGVGFSTGRSVVAVKLQEHSDTLANAYGSVQWGLRVVSQ